MAFLGRGGRRGGREDSVRQSRVSQREDRKKTADSSIAEVAAKAKDEGISVIGPTEESHFTQVSGGASSPSAPSAESERTGDRSGPGDEGGGGDKVGPPERVGGPLLRAGTFSTPGSGLAAGMRSPGMIRGRVGPPDRPFTGRKRTRAGEYLPEDAGGYGGSSAQAPIGISDDEWAQLTARSVRGARVRGRRIP